MQGEGEEEVSIDELASNLSTYKEQLILVGQQLKDDPRNTELADMERELNEVISLTEELLSTAKQTESSGLRPTGFESTSEEHEFSVGDKVQAVYSDDGEWYEGTVESLTPIGYIVRYNGWDNCEEVDHANVREAAANSMAVAERAAEATKEHIKRKIAEAAVTDYQSKVLPAKLKIAPDDPEDVKAAKKKKIHAFKSKARFEQLEVAQNKRQNAWQQFQTTKGKAKKIGFFSGRKRESIFKSPDDPSGRVGVTGSGKGLTDFQKREKHLHLKGGTIEADD